MRPLLTVFVDGLRPESIEQMPFVSGFRNTKRIRTDFGYSVACNCSMYTGVHPNRHLKWFIWQVGSNPMYPYTRYYSWLPGSDLMLTAYATYRIARTFSRKNTSFYGIKYITGSSFRNWHHFEMSEDRFWSEPGFSPEYPTVFDILRANSIDFCTGGFRHFGGIGSIEQIRNSPFDASAPWNYLFIGDIDGLSHNHGPDSIIVREKLLQLDSILEKRFRQYQQEQQDPAFMLFSDHGMTAVNKTFDIRKHFRKHGLNLSKYIHMIDNNFARFWPRSGVESSEIKKVLSTIEPGYVITGEMARKYHINMPDNRYGDIIFYIDLPYAFGRAWYPMGLSSRTKPFHHGYNPDHECMDGVLVSSEPLKSDPEKPNMCDITPSILKMLDIQIPQSMDGQPLWRL